MNGFWHFDAGNMISTATLLLSFWVAHRGNVGRLRTESDRLQQIETKVGTMYRWFEKHVIDRQGE